MANQTTSAFRTFWGEYATIADLPNVATAGFQNDNLALGALAYVTGTGRLYVCTNPTRSAAVWSALELAGGGSLPTFDMLTGVTAGNRYDAASNAWAGVTTGFIVHALFELTAINTGSGQTLLSNINFGVDGWQLNVEANGALNASIVDTAGGAVGPTSGTSLPLTNSIGAHPAPKHWLMTMQVTQNGANNDVALWVNGQLIDTAVGTNPYAPIAAAPTVGRGAFGNVAAESGISGFAYLEGTRTADQLRAHMFEVLEAGDMVDDATGGYSVYSVKRGTPGATWLASDGAALTFNRTGSLTTVERPVPFWG